MSGSSVAELCRAAVVRTDGEYCLVVKQDVPADTHLFTIEGELSATPTRYTVQLDRDLHIDLPPDCRTEFVLDNYFWRFMNHACEPNSVIRGREVISLKPIPAWSQITFHYASTEYDMAEPFRCRCGSPRCEGVVQGFRHLAPHRRERLRPLLSEYLLSILDGRVEEPAAAEVAR
jgi:hypothetical protein